MKLVALLLAITSLNCYGQRCISEAFHHLHPTVSISKWHSQLGDWPELGKAEAVWKTQTKSTLEPIWPDDNDYVPPPDVKLLWIGWPRADMIPEGEKPAPHATLCQVNTSTLQFKIIHYRPDGSEYIEELDAETFFKRTLRIYRVKK
jgi:hypothetical protein